MKPALAGTLMLILSTANVAQAQFGRPWHQMPGIVVIGADGDARIGLVDEAIAFWNTTLEDLGSGFRLSPAVRQTAPVSEQALQALSLSVVGARGPVRIPQALRGLPGDINVVLGESEFVSFTGPFDPDGKRIVAIRGGGFPPLNLPNVARNVIAHELGHAIGLGHNSDPTQLMCGRPSPCRPDQFRSREPRMFPLTDAEKRDLLAMYPVDWKPRSR